jgi:hypothetical protein
MGISVRSAVGLLFDWTIKTGPFIVANIKAAVELGVFIPTLTH